MIHRILSEKILQAAELYPVICITGPRQSGKTTLVQTLFPDYTYINFEDFEYRNFAISDLKGFLKNYQTKIIFDEVQHVPELFSQLQIIVDKNKQKGNFILTGSQNFLLMQKIAQSLAGRTAVFSLLPFSLAEIQHSAFSMPTSGNYMFKGFYPPVYDNQIPPESWYVNYISTYLEKDVRNILQVNNLLQFQNFMKLCAINTGNIVNFSKIASEVGVSYQTVKNWLSVLEASYITYNLPPFYHNYSKRISKTPKFYFYDTGLVCSLLGIKSVEELERSVFKGPIFENFIISEISKHFYNEAEKPPLFYFRDSNANEVDLIIDIFSRRKIVEIKSGATFNEYDADKLLYYKRLQNDQQISAFVVNNGRDNQYRSQYTVLSWQNLLKMFE